MADANRSEVPVAAGVEAEPTAGDDEFEQLEDVNGDVIDFNPNDFRLVDDAEPLADVVEPDAAEDAEEEAGGSSTTQ